MLNVTFGIMVQKLWGFKDFIFNIPHLLWVWDFGAMYITHLETRLYGVSFHIYF